jgi:hypothetical protein
MEANMTSMKQVVLAMPLPLLSTRIDENNYAIDINNRTRHTQKQEIDDEEMCNMRPRKDKQQQIARVLTNTHGTKQNVMPSKANKHEDVVRLIFSRWRELSDQCLMPHYSSIYENRDTTTLHLKTMRVTFVALLQYD